MAKDEPTVLVDKDGKPLSEGDPKGPPVAAKAAFDKRLRDDNGKLLSEGDAKGPPVNAKAPKRSNRDKLYGKPNSNPDGE